MTSEKLKRYLDTIRDYRHYEDEEAAYDSKTFFPFVKHLHDLILKSRGKALEDITYEEAENNIKLLKELEAQLVQTRDPKSIFVPLWNGKPANMCGELTDDDYFPDRADFIPRMVPYTLNDGSYHPAIIVVAGGVRANIAEGDPYCKFFNSIGMHAFQLAHRVGNQDINYSLDFQRAIRLLRANADKYLIDKDRIGAIGSSFGGVVTVSYIENIRYGDTPSKYDPDYKDDEIDEQPDELDFYVGIYTSSNPSKPRPENPMYEQYPPCFFVYGGADSNIKNQIKYFSELVQNDVRIEAHMFDGMAHGVGLANGVRRPNGPNGQIKGPEKWPELCKTWLHRILDWEEI